MRAQKEQKYHRQRRNEDGHQTEIAYLNGLVNETQSINCKERQAENRGHGHPSGPNVGYTSVGLRLWRIERRRCWLIKLLLIPKRCDTRQTKPQKRRDKRQVIQATSKIFA